MSIPLLALKPKRERSILLRHPWIFSGAVQQMPKAEDGDIVAVQTADGERLGYGFFSANSQITCRMFHWGKDVPDFSQKEYWQEKISKAFAIRREMVIRPGTNAYRLLHAEGDFLPGIIADVYNETVVVQVLIKGIEKILMQVADILQEMGFKYIFIKEKNSSNKLEDIRGGSRWIGERPEGSLMVAENGLIFKVDVEGGQKTGFFLDQRDNRALVKIHSQGKTVLNAFSYTGGFSVYALAGGAAEVHSLDISMEAIRVCEENIAMNFEQVNHRGISEDCFEYLKNMPEDLYDLIILDPPAFAKHSRAVENASRGYKQINLQAMKKIKSAGILFTFSCSQNISDDLFQKILFGAAADSGRNVRILYQMHQPPDHPVNIYHPEGKYLKGFALWVE
jgi:23S rRNA (cytosine1962-C5)-methyltransferase